MIAGPWTDRADAYRNWGRFVAVRAIDGRKPVAVERKNEAVRILYALPTDGREAIPVSTFGLPEYVAA